MPFHRLKAILVLLFSSLCIYLSLPSIIGNRKFLPDNKVNLGLDLRGGISIVLEAEDEAYYQEKFLNIADNIKKQIKKSLQIKQDAISCKKDTISIVTDKPDAKDTIQSIINKNGYSNDLVISYEENKLIISPSKEWKSEVINKLIGQSISIIRKRIDESGTKEIDLQRQGDNKILLQVPGLYDVNSMKSLIGRTAKLTIHLVNHKVNKQDIMSGNIPIGTKLLPLAEDTRELVPIQSLALMSGEALDDAQTSKNHMGHYVVQFKMNDKGAKNFGIITSQYRGHALAIVMDDKVISAPRISEPIMTGSGIISGSFSVESANELALLLRSGALPTQLKITEERVIGPTLGQESIDAGVKSVTWASVLVVLIMIVFYGYWGILASSALILNLAMIMAVLGSIGATLTMPGIAGIALTLGMAVDANILIFEKMKEEYRRGISTILSIKNGYTASIGTILDANITTVAAAIILYIFGTAAIKGFAVTLTVGIMCSMFSSIVFTKTAISILHTFYKPKSLDL